MTEEEMKECIEEAVVEGKTDVWNALGDSSIVASRLLHAIRDKGYEIVPTGEAA